MKTTFNYILITLVLGTATSCKKYVEVDPPRTELASASVFANDNTATAAMLGIYSDMNSYNYLFADFMTTMVGSMASDDFTYAAAFASFDEFKNNTVSPSNSYISTLWSEPYDFIYRSNAIIEGVAASAGLSQPVKNQLTGEAKFMRAFCHFYLVNFFGDVPLIQSTDVLTNTSLPRTPAADVYAAIIADLKDAEALLSNDYPGGGERTRPVKAAAELLLARACLYSGDNASAEAEATKVINNPLFQLLHGSDIGKVFLKNSGEAIWQLQPVNTSGGRNTWEGLNMVPANPSVPTAYYRLTKGEGGLVGVFEQGDLRKVNWTSSYVNRTNDQDTIYYPLKYKVRTNTTAVTEYYMVLRFAEAYLIRAEARIQQNKLSEGKSDLDIIRGRAGLGDLPLPATVQQGMLQVEQERRAEFFAEWGHRWFDLKRWKSTSGDASKTRADDILQPKKATWKSTAVLLPIPTDAIKTNPNLIPNPGYN